ncbi:hypothetical protein HK104_007113, partial [Borealophlyctis nickersoniae]
MSKQNKRTIPIKSSCLEPDSDIEEVAPAPPAKEQKDVAKKPAPAKKREAPTSELPVAKKIKDFPKSLDDEGTKIFFYFPVDNDKLPTSAELVELCDENKLKLLMQN